VIAVDGERMERELRGGTDKGARTRQIVRDDPADRPGRAPDSLFAALERHEHRFGPDDVDLVAYFNFGQRFGVLHF